MIVYDRVSLTLRRKRRRTEILTDCSVAIPVDRRVGILGHRLTGKSTVLQLAYGAMLPDKGRIQRSCQLSFPIGSARLCNARLSLRENMVFIGRLYGFDPKPVINFVNDRLGLGIHLDRDFAIMPRDLRKSALCLMTYAMPFDVYCADGSPVTGSPEMRALLDSLLWQRMQTAGLLICSSSPRLLARYCDVFYILKDHKILEVPDLATGIDLLGPPPKGVAPLSDEEEEEPEQEPENDFEL